MIQMTVVVAVAAAVSQGPASMIQMTVVVAVAAAVSQGPALMLVALAEGKLLAQEWAEQVQLVVQ